MVDSPDSILLVRLQATGGNVNLWGGYLNTALSTMTRADKGYQAYTVNGDATINWSNYSASNDFAVANAKWNAGTVAAAFAFTMPNYQQDFLAWNNAGYAGTVKVSGGTGITVPTGRRAKVFCDGTDFRDGAPNWLSSYANPLVNAGDIVTKETLEDAIAAASGLTAPFILVSAADTTAGYLGQKLAEGTGITITTDNPGGDEDANIALDANTIATLQSYGGYNTQTVANTTTQLSTYTNVILSGTGPAVLPTFAADGEFVVVNYKPSAGVTATVGRNSQTIDGTAEDDTYIGDGGVGPIIMYSYSSAGVVVSRLLGGSPV